MKTFSTSQAAKKLGLQVGTLARYIAVGKLPTPTILKVGTASLHAWTEEEIENARQLLPKIANGRKTRYKKQSAHSNQQSAKTKAPARAPVPHKSRGTKEKVRPKPPKG
jgi:predicted DNA-binding transcriptional regulator AlpA